MSECHMVAIHFSDGEIERMKRGLRVTKTSTFEMGSPYALGQIYLASGTPPLAASSYSAALSSAGSTMRREDDD